MWVFSQTLVLQDINAVTDVRCGSWLGRHRMFQSSSSFSFKLGFCTPFAVSRGVRLQPRMLAPWTTRLLTQWMLRRWPSQWQHRALAVRLPSTPNTRIDRYAATRFYILYSHTRSMQRSDHARNECLIHDCKPPTKFWYWGMWEIKAVVCRGRRTGRRHRASKEWNYKN